MIVERRFAIRFRQLLSYAIKIFDRRAELAVRVLTVLRTLAHDAVQPILTLAIYLVDQVLLIQYQLLKLAQTVCEQLRFTCRHASLTRSPESTAQLLSFGQADADFSNRF